MARSLIELLDATGSIHGQWRTDSHSALVEKFMPSAQGSAKDVKDLLFKVDLLPTLASATSLGLPPVAYDALPEENKLVVYADLFVPEFRAAERFFYEQVVPAGIRAFPTREVLDMRKKVYGEKGNLRKDVTNKRDKAYWNQEFVALYNDFLDTHFESARIAIGQRHSELYSEPLFIAMSGAYEAALQAIRGYAKKDNPERHKSIVETPTLTLLKRFE